MSYNINTTNNIPSQGVTREYNGKQFLVIHSTSDLNATATDEATYFNREWESTQTFVQDIIDDSNLYHIYPYGNRAWGAGNINSYAYGQIEICEFSDAERSKQAISNAIVLARNIINDAKSKGVSLEIVSHHEASNQFGGSDHTDPDEYFSRFGYTMDWFRSQVNQTTLQPQPQPQSQNTSLEDDELMKFTYEIIDANTGKSQGTIYFYDGTKVVALSHPDQWKIITTIYHDTTSQNMTHYKWRTDAPWHIRFLQAINQKAPETAWK